MARLTATRKTCQRCGRSGSHAFRRTPDGLYECSTATACRARARRNAGASHEGRGRMPSQRGLCGGALGAAFVIGPDDDERELVAGNLGELTDLMVVSGAPEKATLAALGSRNVRLIAVAAEALDGVGFRNEFTLRCRQPRLSSVPILVYGQRSEVDSAVARLPRAGRVAYEAPAELVPRLRQQVARLEPAEAS